MPLDVYIPMVSGGSVYQAPYYAAPIAGVQNTRVDPQQAAQQLVALNWTPENIMTYLSAQDAAVTSNVQREAADRDVEKANWRLNLQTAARLQDEELRLQEERRPFPNPHPSLIPTYQNKMPEWSYRQRGSGMSEEDIEGYKSSISRTRRTGPPPR